MTKALKLELFSDYVWPWCYLSTVRIEKLKKNYNIDVKLVHFPLHPDTPAEGREMAGFYRERGLDADQMYKDMKARMEAEGLPYGRRTHTYNSRLAQELAKWAEDIYNPENLEKELYKAYFVNSKNIGDLSILLSVVKSAGLPCKEAEAVIENRTYRLAVDEDWEKSKSYGVSGVPTYIAGGYGVVGAQPYEALEQLINEAGAVKRP